MKSSICLVPFLLVACASSIPGPADSEACGEPPRSDLLAPPILGSGEDEYVLHGEIPPGSYTCLRALLVYSDDPSQVWQIAGTHIYIPTSFQGDQVCEWLRCEARGGRTHRPEYRIRVTHNHPFAFIAYFRVDGAGVNDITVGEWNVPPIVSCPASDPLLTIRRLQLDNQLGPSIAYGLHALPRNLLGQRNTDCLGLIE